MRKILLALAIVSAFSLGWAARDWRAELLAVQKLELDAHLKTDASLLQPSAGPMVSVSSGKISRITPEASHAFFTEYFRNAHYPLYENAEPPIVGVSQDGTLGYVISRVRAHRVQAGADGKSREGRFVYAGIMVYEWRDGRYVRVANVSTFEP